MKKITKIAGFFRKKCIFVFFVAYTSVKSQITLLQPTLELHGSILYTNTKHQSGDYHLFSPTWHFLSAEQSTPPGWGCQILCDQRVWRSGCRIPGKIRSWDCVQVVQVFWTYPLGQKCFDSRSLQVIFVGKTSDCITTVSQARGPVSLAFLHSLHFYHGWGSQLVKIWNEYKMFFQQNLAPSIHAFHCKNSTVK